MDIMQLYARKEDKPLDCLADDGGFCKIFRRMGCIGDSFSSRQFESCDERGARGFHNFFAYSWGQYMAREAGIEVYNFSLGGYNCQGIL